MNWTCYWFIGGNDQELLNVGTSYDGKVMILKAEEESVFIYDKKHRREFIRGALKKKVPEEYMESAVNMVLNEQGE